MKRKAFLYLVIAAIMLTGIAFSLGNYGFQDAYSDAQTVHAYFNGHGSEKNAGEAYDRLYDFWYKDAREYVLNKNKGKFHLPTCKSVSQMNESNKVFITYSREMLLAVGYEPCGNCHP